MIKIENVEVYGWEAAIRGMRNPMNSRGKSDSKFEEVFEDTENLQTYYQKGPEIGPNDHDLMMRLAAAGPVHAKYRRMIVVYADITAPLYWWKGAETYKVGTVSNSCSTMHKIHAKEFTLDDFSHEHLTPASRATLRTVVEQLNHYRDSYNKEHDDIDPQRLFKKDYWWQMIQLLPSSYNQRRTFMFNYEVLSRMYKDRKNHKLDEWRDFCAWIESLPYSEIITGGKND